jgi:HK97 family phage major capsid protein
MTTGSVTRADVINIAKGILGDTVKEALERSDMRIRKMEEALAGNPALAARFKNAGDPARSGPMNSIFGPAHLITRSRTVVDGENDDGTPRFRAERLEETPDEYIQRHRGRNAQSRLFAAGLGTASIRDHRGIMAARLMRTALIASGNLEAMDNIAKSWDDIDLRASISGLSEIVKGLTGTSTRGLTPEFAARAMGLTDVAEAKVRALGTNDLTAGGALVPAIYAAEILDILHARVVVDALGAMSLPLEGGDIKQPFMDQGVGVSRVGENAAVNATEPTFGELILTGHELAAAVPIGNKLMASASVSVDAMIRDHLVKQFRKMMDLDCIRGRGESNKVRGLDYWVDQASASHQFNRQKAGADSTVDEITEDLVAAIAVVEGEDLPLDAGGWVLSVRDKYGLFRRRGSDGHLVFEPEMRSGVLWGFPFGATTQVPTNLGGTGSVVYFGDFSTMVHAERAGIQVEAVRGAAYNDATGSVVSGASRRQTVVFANAEHDFGCLYRGKEVAKIKLVDWGT